MNLTAEQQAIVESPLESKLFLRGMAGVGKTTAGVRRLRHLIESGVPAHSIMVLVPQKRLALPYYAEIRNPRRKAGAEVTIATLGSLSRQMVNLYWPLITNLLSPSFPNRRPRFLSLEMVQYLMFKLLDEEIDRKDYFNSVTIARARLFSQIADNLNKSAVVGFPHTSIAARLKAAFADDQERRHIFDDAQVCANLFRDYCRRYNLLDFSLQVELFCEGLWNFASPRDALVGRYTHLIVDNLEEDTPATHRLLRDWLPACRSALLIHDDEAGYRKFLGADDVHALTLREACDREVVLDRTRVMSKSMQALLAELSMVMREAAETTGADVPGRKAKARRAIAHTELSRSRFHTQMLDWVAESIENLVHRKKVRPRRIVVLAPLMNDSLRFSLVSRLEQRGVESYTLRPSRPLHAEPAVGAVVTLAKLAHPHWKLASRHEVRKFDVVRMLMCAIDGIDLARASLLAEVLYKKEGLQSFSRVTNAEMRVRMTEVFGERYERLRAWIESYRNSVVAEAPEPIDLFLRRLFGEVLSQPGFGFHRDYDAVRIVSNLITSARSFRQSVEQIESRIDAGNEYIRMVDEGILADQYEPYGWKKHPNAVLIAPAYTFLLSNQAVDYQFWLNLDSPAWNRRLYQPLTQPYVLSAQWNRAEKWTDVHEREASREMLLRVVTGLVKRCRRKIFLGFSKYDERGFEQVGELRIVFDYLLRGLAASDAGEEAHD